MPTVQGAAQLNGAGSTNVYARTLYEVLNFDDWYQQYVWGPLVWGQRTWGAGVSSGLKVYGPPRLSWPLPT